MIHSTQLDGVALVVGSAIGIGQQAAFSLAEAGAKVVVFADINEEKAKESSKESKQYASNKEYRITAFKVDIADAKGVQDMVDFMVKEFGNLNYSVNAAGDRIMSINAKVMMMCVRAEAAVILKQPSQSFKSRNGVRDIGRGAIVNVASANSYAGVPGKMPYTASKHAVIGPTKVTAIDHEPEGIRCNTVCPTRVRTPLIAKEMEKHLEIMELVKAVVPIQHMAESEEVADTIAFLCSPAASYINGTSVIIDNAVTTTVSLH